MVLAMGMGMVFVACDNGTTSGSRTGGLVGTTWEGDAFIIPVTLKFINSNTCEMSISDLITGERNTDTRTYTINADKTITLDSGDGRPLTARRDGDELTLLEDGEVLAELTRER
jgi:hypothetical protein